MDVPENAAYIEWQGNNSKDFGLVLTSIPRVKYPQNRYEELYIPHRDGSLLEFVGRGCFDMQIDLAYITPDRDNSSEFLLRWWFIQFLTQWTHISYKNKLHISFDSFTWFDATIIEGIDWEDVQRKKTATITFHCQPRKGILNTEEHHGQPTFDIVDNKYSLCWLGNSLYNTSTPSSAMTVDISGLDLANVERRPMLRCTFDEACCSDETAYVRFTIWHSPYIDVVQQYYVGHGYYNSKEFMFDYDIIRTTMDDYGGKIDLYIDLKTYQVYLTRCTQDPAITPEMILLPEPYSHNVQDMMPYVESFSSNDNLYIVG